MSGALFSSLDTPDAVEAWLRKVRGEVSYMSDGSVFISAFVQNDNDQVQRWTGKAATMREAVNKVRMSIWKAGL